MKKRFIYCLALAAVFGQAFTSCKSDDDPDVPGVNLTEKTYCDDLLNVTLNGEPLLGKSVTFIPDGKGMPTSLLKERNLTFQKLSE